MVFGKGFINVGCYCFWFFEEMGRKVIGIEVKVLF